jgi:hypothetical protein
MNFRYHSVRTDIFCPSPKGAREDGVQMNVITVVPTRNGFLRLYGIKGELHDSFDPGCAADGDPGLWNITPSA